MANETIEERKIYRVLVDKTTKLWRRMYLLTSANSVICNDGMYAEEKIGDLKGMSTVKRGVAGYAMDASVAELAPEELVGTLYAGQTTISWTSAKITDDCIIKTYLDKYDVAPKTKIQTGSTFTMTFPVQVVDVGIIVHVYSR